MVDGAGVGLAPAEGAAFEMRAAKMLGAERPLTVVFERERAGGSAPSAEEGFIDRLFKRFVAGAAYLFVNMIIFVVLFPPVLLFDLVTHPAALFGIVAISITKVVLGVAHSLTHPLSLPAILGYAFTPSAWENYESCAPYRVKSG